MREHWQKARLGTQILSASAHHAKFGLMTALVVKMRILEEKRSTDAELRTSSGLARLVSYAWSGPVSIDKYASTHHLEMTLLPQEPRAVCGFPGAGGSSRLVPIGELFYFPPAHRISCQCPKVKQRSIVVEFDDLKIARWTGIEWMWTEKCLLGGLDISCRHLRSLLLRLAEELRVERFASGQMAELLMHQIAIELSRYLASIVERRPAGGMANWRLRRIDERVNDDTRFAPDLTELANLCHMSIRHLTRAYRVSRGVSIAAYIAGRNMDRAKRLLLEGRSVKSVAFAIGFTQSSNFSASFLRHTGETPSEFRSRMISSMRIGTST